MWPETLQLAGCVDFCIHVWWLRSCCRLFYLLSFSPLAIPSVNEHCVLCKASWVLLMLMPCYSCPSILATNLSITGPLHLLCHLSQWGSFFFCSVQSPQLFVVPIPGVSNKEKQCCIVTRLCCNTTFGFPGIVQPSGRLTDSESNAYGNPHG